MHLPSRTAGGVGRRPAALAGVLAAAALALAACGSSTATSASASRATPTSTPTSTPTAPPGASGTIAALTGQSMEVQNPRSGQTTVTYTATTTFTQTVSATASAVTTGACVTAVAAPPAGRSSSSSTTVPATPPKTLSATTVLVHPAVAGSCSRGGPGGFGARRPSGTTAPRGSVPANRRRGAFGAGRFASGEVAAVTGTSFTVTETNPKTGAHTTVTVDTTSSTQFSQTEPATPADLAVGKCVRALGPASSTGAVSARSLAISSPGPSGCTAGFGAGGFGAGRPGGQGTGVPAGGVASA